MRIVVKLGTSVLTDGSDRLQRPRMVDLVRQMADLRAAGHEVVLVSSGAVLAGWEQLGFPKRRRDLAHKQALAAVGQSRLMHVYAQLFDIYGVTVAQALLNRDDIRDRSRYLNARATLLTCLEAGVLPIINENDAVVVDEIRVGDNDNLSAYIANVVDADLVIILSDIAGLFSADPRVNPQAELIHQVAMVSEEIFALAGAAAGSHRGTGGMRTKLEAARLATRSGIELVIAAGNVPNVLAHIVAGDLVGTRFTAAASRLESRKRWIMAEYVRGALIVVDHGAVQAVTRSGGSLLPAGVVAIEGLWQRGQTVYVAAREQPPFACGLTQYASHEVARLCGVHSQSIEAVLGYSYGAEIIHRDDLIVV